MQLHATTQPPVIWRLVEESLSEAAFLWRRLDRALEAPDHTLEDAERWVQERLSGALDGVLLAADAAVAPLLTEALTDPDPGYVSVAVYLLAALRTPKANLVLEERLRELVPEQLPLFVAGLRRTHDTALLQQLHVRLGSTARLASAALIEALTACAAPVDLDYKACLSSDEPTLRRAAASALGQLSSSQRAEIMWVALQSPDIEVRTRAILAAVLAGDSNAWRRCVEAVRKAPRTSGPLLCLTAMLGSSDEHAVVINALAEPEVTVDALWALGFAGTRSAVDACMAQVSGAASNAALEAISWIVGEDVSQLGQAPDNATASADVEQTQSGAVAAERLKHWWSSQRERFDPGKRYQRGVPFHYARLHTALASGPAHRRQGLAAELCARTSGAQRIQTWAFCPQQRKQLALLEALDPQELHTHAKSLGFAALERA